MGLIIPKHHGDVDILDIVLKIYYEAAKIDSIGWVENNFLIEQLSKMLLEYGYQAEEKEPQSYTKKTQLIAYYGFLTWENIEDKRSRRRITDLGKRFYEARKNKDQDKINEILIESLTTLTFGRNVVGCSSDSDIEAPNVFIKASIILGGISNSEYACILEEIECKKRDLLYAIMKISLNRQLGRKIEPSPCAKKWKDAKPINVLRDWGLLDSQKRVSENVLIKYTDILLNLRVLNNEENIFLNSLDSVIQCIYFGTPGSGKSFKVKKVVGEIDANGYNIDCPNVFRTTFHPDSDYSTFVGCYKPMMEEIDGEKEDLVYEFVPQAFTDAYVYAYEHEEEPTYLVIEEINRGNCAQIFGDLFQLLDRNESGCSDYSIKADKDLRKYLEDKLGVGHEGIKYGKLSLPSNLNIVATMNTSDQSLFPMDSAFKRRWEWIYVPIEYEDKNVPSTSFEISVGNKKYSWIEFLKAVNTKIKEVTDSEDKQMGNFFIKDSIDKEKFVNKVMSYLWFEVCKENYGSADYFFHYIKDNTDSQSESVDNEDSFTYNDLFSDKCEEILNGFMKYLNVQELDNSNMTSTEVLEEG